MNNSIIDRFVSDLKLRSYAKRSIKSYLRSVRQMHEFCDMPFEHITEEDLREYWLHCREERKWSSATLRISYSGIKHFFTFTMKRDWEVLRAIRFERNITLPVVLNIDEVRKILSSFNRLQNRAYFTLLYSCGLRLGEGLNLKVGDIDSKRQLIHVHHGKGAKDRYVPLPETTLGLLREYYRTHMNPVWIFPSCGRGGGRGLTAEEPVSATTVQGALRRCVVRIGLKKKIRPHTFRHSYATHMIEAGVPVRHVQDYLGHRSLASVMIYLHITTHGREATLNKLNQLMRGLE